MYVFSGQVYLNVCIHKPRVFKWMYSVLEPPHNGGRRGTGVSPNLIVFAAKSSVYQLRVIKIIFIGMTKAKTEKVTQIKSVSVSILYLICKFQEDRFKNKKKSKICRDEISIIYSFIHVIHNYFPILLEYEELDISR